MAKYGLVTTGYTPRLALSSVGRWNDGVKRHTLYTCCGTQQDGWGIVDEASPGGVAIFNMVSPTGPITLAQLQAMVGNHAPPWAASPDTVVGASANPNLFNWVAVSYPASMPIAPAPLDNQWQPSNLSLAQSVQVGVNELTQLIQNTPGTFVLCGMSQGSMVVTKVMQSLLPGGVLSSRIGDCIAGIAFGNPMRKPGVTFPGGTASSTVISGSRYYGGGIYSGAASPSTPILSGNGPITTPNWWWEMSTVGDFFSDAPMETVAGPLIGEVARVVASYPGGSDMLTTLGGAGRAFMTGNLTVGSIGSAIKLLTAQKAVQNIVTDWLSTALALFGGGSGKPNGHMLYGINTPPTLPTGLTFPTAKPTYIDVALAYLHARGAAVTPR